MLGNNKPGNDKPGNDKPGNDKPGNDKVAHRDNMIMITIRRNAEITSKSEQN